MSWRDRYYEVGYLRRWHLPPPSADQLAEASAFLALADQGSGSVVLDLGCGHGRYAYGMAQVGARVVGLDASAALLRRAQEQAIDRNRAVHWVRVDMLALPFVSRFEMVLIVDAFGYFDSDSDDARCLAEVGRVLTPGGRLVMRNPNAIPIRRDFRVADEEHRKGQTAGR